MLIHLSASAHSTQTTSQALFALGPGGKRQWTKLPKSLRSWIFHLPRGERKQRRRNMPGGDKR